MNIKPSDLLIIHSCQIRQETAAHQPVEVEEKHGTTVARANLHLSCPAVTSTCYAATLQDSCVVRIGVSLIFSGVRAQGLGSNAWQVVISDEP